MASELNVADKDRVNKNTKINSVASSNRKKAEKSGEQIDSFRSEEVQHEDEKSIPGSCDQQEAQEIKEQRARASSARAGFAAFARDVEESGCQATEGPSQADKICQKVAGYKRRVQPLGDSQREELNKGRILEEAERVLRLRHFPPAPLREGGGFRRSPLRLCGRAVPERRGQPRGKQVAGGTRVRETSDCQIGDSPPPKIQESFEGLEEACPAASENADDGVFEELCVRHPVVHGRDRDGVVQRNVVLNILQAWRAFAFFSRRRG